MSSNRSFLKVLAVTVFVISAAGGLEARPIKGSFGEKADYTIGITGTDKLEWRISRLPCSPSDRSCANPGLAGSFVGYVGDNLIIAGGDDLTDGTVLTGGTGRWCSDLYIQNPDGTWKYYGSMPNIRG